MSIRAVRSLFLFSCTLLAQLAPPANPVDLTFVVTTPKEPYAIGERIPITLHFSSTSPNKYRLDCATYDRSGRLPSEEFVSDSPKPVDPYAIHFGTGVLGSIGGGLRSYADLAQKPNTIDLVLNNWFRFDEPGTYRFFLKSHRLSRARSAGEPGTEATVQLAAVSNIFEIRIVPADPNQEAAKLLEIRKKLQEAKFNQTGPSDRQVSDSLAELRYLATPAAIKLAFDFAREWESLPQLFTLAAARDRAHMLSEFDRFLAEPGLSFTSYDIRIRALFGYFGKPSPPVPSYSWQLRPGQPWRPVQKLAEEQSAEFESYVRETAAALIPTALRKDDKARKRAAEAIAELVPDLAKASGLIPPDDYGLTRAELIARFPQFPKDQQIELLTRKWDLVRGPEMIPVLERILAAVPVDPLSSRYVELGLSDMSATPANYALPRLFRLSPQSVDKILRADVASPEPRFAAFAARDWPARVVPEASNTLAAALKSNPGLALPLIARFGGPALRTQMQELYESRDWPCKEEASFLTFFLRVEPKSGAAALTKAMQKRERRGCHNMVLGQIARIVWNDVLQSQAIATLSDPDPETVINAVQMLANHGSAAVEPLLWRRLEQWVQESHATIEEHNLGDALFSSIVNAKSWFLDPTRQAHLLALCPDADCRRRWANGLPSTIPLSVSDGGGIYPAVFRIGNYTAPSFQAMKEKVAQFPASSQFAWCPLESDPFDTFTPGERAEMFSELTRWLAERGMTLDLCPKAP